MSLDTSSLRGLVHEILQIEHSLASRAGGEAATSVTASDVVRYHDGEDPKDDIHSNIRSVNEHGADGVKILKSIEIADNDVSRHAECINCREV